MSKHVNKEGWMTREAKYRNRKRGWERECRSGKERGNNCETSLKDWTKDYMKWRENYTQRTRQRVTSRLRQRIECGSCRPQWKISKRNWRRLRDLVLDVLCKKRRWWNRADLTTRNFKTSDVRSMTCSNLSKTCCKSFSSLRSRMTKFVATTRGKKADPEPTEASARSSYLHGWS